MVAAATPRPVPRHCVLLLEDDPDLAELYSVVLHDAGYAVEVARNGHEGLDVLRRASPDLIVSDIMMPEMDGLAFLREVRADAALRFLPVIMLTSRANIEDVVEGFAIGADDYIPKPVDPRELAVRVAARIDRPPVPADSLREDRKSGLMNEAGLVEAATAEIERAMRDHVRLAVARIRIYELERLTARLGPLAGAAVARAFGRMLGDWLGPRDLAARLEDGSFAVVMPAAGQGEAARRLDELCRGVVHTRIDLGAEQVYITPVSGFAMLAPGLDAASRLPPETLLARAGLAVATATGALDLRPVAYRPEMEVPAPPPRSRAWWRTLGAAMRARAALPAQILATYVLALGLPFAVYVGFGRLGITVTHTVYWVAVACMVITCVLIWCEGLLSRREAHPPELGEADFGPVSAVIAAYLPNEAATLESTIGAFLRMDYPAGTQIILAYNTPVDMPIEKRLRDIARADPRFVPLRVYNSTSKAENVNAALSHVTSEVVGIFDADHQPDPDSFRRAWRWIADGADVVQGHCLVRNGAASWIARTVAVEFEMIYTVSHVGRARLHGFGIFGGSNGYWRTRLLREIRMRGAMLTEDIDSAVRSVQAGRRIVNDRFLISRELAPTTLKAFTNQRLRWAQGWFQVAMKQIGPTLRSPHMTLRQKLGMFHLLIWRELFPWLSLQIFPIIGYHYYIHGNVAGINWLHPVLLWLTLFVFLTGPGQLIFTRANAAPEIRAERGWFRAFLWRSILFFAGYKNLLARVANLKELSGEAEWKVTARN